MRSSDEQEVKEPTNDENVVEILDEKNEGSIEDCLSPFCKKKIKLEEEFETSRINE